MCIFKSYKGEYEECLKDNDILLDELDKKDDIIELYELTADEKDRRIAELEAKLKFDKSHWTIPIELPSADVDLILLANLQHWQNGVFRWPMDNIYHINTDEEIIEYIIWNDVDGCKYKPEFKDCEDFAFKFRGDYTWHTECNNCGLTIDWSGRHAYIVFVRQNNAMWVYEPQSDSWWDTGSQPTFGNMYPLEHAGILL